MIHQVEIRDLNFGYGDQLVLKGIHLTVPKGSLVAIMGLSGCGKTTLLRLMGGQLLARQGSVRVAGQELNHMNEAQLYAMRRQVGMLFQFGALFTDLSVFDNVAFQMREHTRLPESMIRDLTLMKLNAVGLRGVQSLMPAELSGG
ncbi:MAG: ATP-binding cassette domain-containing protein, partial [Ferrovum sp.]|nr:ATP-binding cassette domain-containing protein [Ferrovum sp.]